MLSELQVQRNDADRLIGSGGAKRDAVAIGPNRAEFREEQFKWMQGLALQVQHRKVADACLGIGADDPIAPCACIGRRATARS